MRAEVTAEVRGGETLGSPIAMTIRNRDFDNWRGAKDPWDIDEAAGVMKYDRTDLRDILRAVLGARDGVTGSDLGQSFVTLNAIPRA